MDPRPTAPRYVHEWSGSNKTIDEMLEEQDRWLESLGGDERGLRMGGNYFGHLEDEWDKMQHRLVPQDFITIKRSPSQGALYKSCYAHIRNEIRDPDWTSGTANQQGNVEKVDPVGNMGGQAAHLLSHSAVCHRAYPFLAEAAIGIAIEAMHLPGHSDTNRRKILVGVKGEHFDSDNPSVLVVPLLPLEQILDWATDQEHAVPNDVAVFTFGPRRRVVARDTLQYAKGTCSSAERTLARENLSTFVKGIASHLVTENVFESLPDKYFTAKNPSLLRWRELVKQLRENPQVLVPTRLDGADPNVRIAKARMSTGTSLPDPWLLLANSAINYTASNGQKVMSTCLPPEESNSEDDDYYELPPRLTLVNDEYGDAKMDDVRAGFYEDALQRSGFPGPWETN